MYVRSPGFGPDTSSGGIATSRPMRSRHASSGVPPPPIGTRTSPHQSLAVLSSSNGSGGTSQGSQGNASQAPLLEYVPLKRSGTMLIGKTSPMRRWLSQAITGADLTRANTECRSRDRKQQCRQSRIRDVSKTPPNRAARPVIRWALLGARLRGVRLTLRVVTVEGVHQMETLASYAPGSARRGNYHHGAR